MLGIRCRWGLHAWSKRPATHRIGTTIARCTRCNKVRITHKKKP